jgi:SMC interacting uncharacterized protein involved in chromosome segregation
MKELKELENRINEMKKRIEELKEKNRKLEYDLFMYDSDYKSELSQKLNTYENAFIEFIEEYQNDNCTSDEELCKFNLFGDLFDEFMIKMEKSIDVENIKKYFNYSRYVK